MNIITCCSCFCCYYHHFHHYDYCIACCLNCKLHIRLCIRIQYVKYSISFPPLPLLSKRVRAVNVRHEEKRSASELCGSNNCAFFDLLTPNSTFSPKFSCVTVQVELNVWVYALCVCVCVQMCMYVVFVCVCFVCECMCLRMRVCVLCAAKCYGAPIVRNPQYLVCPIEAQIPSFSFEIKGF